MCQTPSLSCDDILGVVHGFVAALDDKAHIERIQVQVGGRIAQPEPVVESARSFLAQDQVLGPAAAAVSDEHVLHRDERLVGLGRAPAELAAAGIGISQPDARHEIGRLAS